MNISLEKEKHKCIEPKLFVYLEINKNVTADVRKC